jgi:hypothetical protein
MSRCPVFPDLVDKYISVRKQTLVRASLSSYDLVARGMGSDRAVLVHPLGDAVRKAYQQPVSHGLVVVAAREDYRHGDRHYSARAHCDCEHLAEHNTASGGSTSGHKHGLMPRPSDLREHYVLAYRSLPRACQQKSAGEKSRRAGPCRAAVALGSQAPSPSIPD